jgi:hypothetical protein
MGSQKVNNNGKVSSIVALLENGAWNNALNFNKIYRFLTLWQQKYLTRAFLESRQPF